MNAPSAFQHLAKELQKQPIFNTTCRDYLSALDRIPEDQHHQALEMLRRGFAVVGEDDADANLLTLYRVHRRLVGLPSVEVLFDQTGEEWDQLRRLLEITERTARVTYWPAEGQDLPDEILDLLEIAGDPDHHPRRQCYWVDVPAEQAERVAAALSLKAIELQAVALADSARAAWPAWTREPVAAG